MRPIWDNGLTAGVAFRHAVHKIEAEGIKIDDIICMLPTSPLKFRHDLELMTTLYRDVGCDSMNTAAPIKEACILRNDRPYEQRYGATDNEPGSRRKLPVVEARNFLFDKFWNYSKVCGGWSIAKRDWLMDVWNRNPKRDIDIDQGPLDTTTKQYIYPVQEWQCTEIDYPEDVKLVDLLMDTFILHGRTPKEVYGEY